MLIIDESLILRALRSQEDPNVFVFSKIKLATQAYFFEQYFPSLRLAAINASNTEVLFMNRLHEIHSMALDTLNDESQAILLSLIPWEVTEGKNGIDLVAELLKWFNSYFWKLNDVPCCHYCGSSTVYDGNRRPTKEEIRKGVDKVERYKCSVCEAITPMYRYFKLNPLILEKKGNSDEAAFVFSAFLRAIDIPTRLVYHFSTDHVSVEFFNTDRMCYVHMDPAENIIDCPLVYDTKLSTKITFIVAVGAYECVDVTRKYVSSIDNMNSVRDMKLKDKQTKISKLIKFRNEMWISSCSMDAKEKVVEMNQQDKLKYEDH